MPAHVDLVGRTVRTGRRYHKSRVVRALTSRKDLHLRNYINERSLFTGLPAFARHGYAIPESAFPMYGNDTLGDCTCAALGHLTHVLAYRDGLNTPLIPTESDVVKMYWDTGKEDTGRYMKDVLDHWRAHPYPTLPSPLAYVRVDPTNAVEVKTAIYLFGDVYIGLALPKAAQQMVNWSLPTNQDLHGDYEPGSWGGHAINLQSYVGSRYGGVTWGERIVLNHEFLKAYCDEMYAIIHPSWLDAGETPAGFNLEQLQTDLQAL